MFSPQLKLLSGILLLAIIFVTTIVCVLSNVLPIFVAAIAGVAVAVLSGVMEPAQAYRGFSENFILLIVAAFLIARAVVKSGLGHRMAWMIIARFGHSSMGVAYSLVATDIIIAPAFSSNTARAGAYLMMVAMGSLTLSSSLWLTAMAANAAGVAIARAQGIDITFGSWLLIASVPCLAAAFMLPRLIYRWLPPELSETPEAPAVAAKKLQAMGPMSRNEKNTAVIFCGMVLLWALADIMGTDLAAIAFGGLALLMICGIFDTRDLQQEGGTLEVFVWFAILYAMSTALNELGFMEWLGAHISVAVGGLDWPLVYVALLPVFLEVGVGAGVPGSLMAFQYYLPPITLPQSRRRRARRMFSLPEAAIWKLRKFTVPACCSLWPIPLSLASSEPSGFFWSTADRSKGAAPQQNLAA